MKGITAIQFSCVISGLVLDNHFRNYLNQNVRAEQNFRQVPFLFKVTKDPIDAHFILF